jgi:biopolymer transport protein ExbB
MISASSGHLAAAAPDLPRALENTWNFFVDGGAFMALIVACSLVALAAIIYKLLALKKARILPERLAEEVEHFEEHLENGTVRELQAEFRRGETSLARLCAVAIRNAGHTQTELKEAVQSSAREEVVKMHAGLPVLDVVITIAPLLGLLGTASGLVVVFGDGNLASNPDHGKIAAGIARALGTTIAGLVVAVPSVVAYSYFTRKIETMAARLEVLLSRVVSAVHQHAFFKQ